MKTISRYLMTLALLITAAASAWAQTETLLTTITATGQTTYSETTAGVVTVTHDNDDYNGDYGWLWYEHAGSITVEAKEGYTITRCVFRQSIKTPFTVSTAPFKVDFIETSDPEFKQYLCQGYMDGVSSIEVYGYAAPAGPAVTIADGNGEASFEMPQYDVTATYTIKRDMSVDVDGEMANRIRIKKNNNVFEPVDATQMNPVVKDNLETNSPVTLTVTTDYTLQLQKQSETDETVWTDATALSVGNFRYKITGAGNYSGIAYSNTFKLFLGYELEIAAGKYATFYTDEAVTVDTETSSDGELYTISSVDGDNATATQISDDVVAANTPLLVKNRNASETKKILLIPTTETAATVTFYEGFKGTLEAKTTANNDAYGPWNMDEGKKYYGFNGTDFVWIREAGNVAAHRCWIELSTTAASAAPQIRLIFSSTTGIESVDREQSTVDGWYDLNGRRLPGKPTKKGVYIVNGKKMVVK